MTPRIHARLKGSRSATHVLLLVIAAVAGVLAPAAARAQTPAPAVQLNENCTVSVLNRNVRVHPDGSWVLPNVPANFGLVRARATCIVDGETIAGESDPFLVPANGVVNLPRLRFNRATPIPQSLTIAAPAATIGSIGGTLQLTVTARFADGSEKDVTASSAGTQYGVSNAAIATVSTEGLVQAAKGGTVLIQATNEGASGMTAVQVILAGTDSDGDGMPDDYELAHGFDPHNPIDAQEDPDRDGLTNLQEFQRGTDPRNADTDGDGLKDGQEIARGTNPLLWDSDGDGISDGLEVQTGSNPLDPASQNLSAALASIRVTPVHFGLTFNTVIGEASVQLNVIGTMRDGRTIDVTSTGRGTNYASNAIEVCSFGARDGQVFAGASGGCIITVTSNSFTATASGDVTNFSPTALSSIAIPGYANNVDVNGHFAYVAAGAAGLVVVDASNPASPVIVGSIDTPGNANDVRVVGNLAYVADGSAGLQIIDVSAPASPHIRGTVDTPGDASDVIVAGPIAYVADGTAGLQIVDVSDPSAPVLVRSLKTPGTARGVDVAGSIAVVVSDVPVTGLQVIDITNPAAATIVGQIPLDGQPTDVSLGKGYAYVAAYTGGVKIVDIRQPATPVVVGGLPGSFPDGFVPRDVQFAGQFAIFAEQLFANAVAPIVDVSDPTHPRFRAVLDFGQDYAGTGIAVSGPYVFWTGQSFVVSQENGTTGNTRLFIGQYLALEDRGGVPPTVSITAPLNGASLIAGTSVTVRATASDDVAVSSVEFLVNGQPVFVDTSEPYEHTFTVPSTAGTMIVSAIASDLGNNTTTAADVTVAVVPDPLTTVAGRVVDAAGQPIAGVTVRALSHEALTGPDGTFSIADVPTVQPFVIVSAALVRDGQTFTGTSAPVPPVRSGTTDVGDIVATVTTFETSLGRLVATCCDVTVDLPFDFPLAGGVRRQIHINDGYVWTREGDEIDALCCLGLTADPNNPASGVYVNDALPGRFVITWYRQTTFSREGGAGAPLDPSNTITMQMILFADGRLQLGYQGVAPPVFADTGLFLSNERTLTAVDFSAGALTTSTGEDVWEDFDEALHPFDLAGGFLVFTPNAGGGYDIRPVPDVVAPVCTVAPASGTVVFEGEPIQIVANATDNGSVARVRFKSAAGGIDTDLTTAPFAVPFVVPVGVHDITFDVTAFDGWGNAGSCATTLSVVPGPPPSVAISSIAGGATTVIAGATIPIAIDATNRVPVTKVDFLVNGVPISSDATSPFALLFTVPAGVDRLTFTAIATDSVGKSGTSATASVTVTPDPQTTLRGRIVDKAAAPVAAAEVTATLRGATVEIFDADTPLTAVPDLAGRTPDRTAIVSAINLRNPRGVFGVDPFGFGESASRATRIRTTVAGSGAGTYTFKLGVKAGGRLIVNGTTVVDLPVDTGQFQEGTGTIAIPQGELAVEIQTFDNGNPELQLSYGAGANAALDVAAGDKLSPFIADRATSDLDGTFSFAGVPTTLGAITVAAAKTIDARNAKGHSAATAPLPGATTDVGDVRITAGGRIGYYDLSAGRGSFNQVQAITTAGLQAIDVGDLNTADLNQFDVLLVQNPDNGGYTGVYRNNVARINQWIADGGTLIFHDRHVTTAATILPGAPGTIVRDFADDRNIDIVDDTTLVTHGPGGTITNASLDNGNSSSHGWIDAATIPAGARGILGRTNPAHLVTYTYPFGLGHVIYSTIPLDFYLGSNVGLNGQMQNYAANVVAFANEQR